MVDHVFVCINEMEFAFYIGQLSKKETNVSS